MTDSLHHDDHEACGTSKGSVGWLSDFGGHEMRGVRIPVMTAQPYMGQQRYPLYCQCRSSPLQR
jgi:hypothetical protein